MVVIDDMECYNFSVTLLACCLPGMSTHNAGIGLVETLKYKIFLGEYAARPQVEAYLTF